MSSPKASNSAGRVIAGTARGRALVSPGEGTRPIGDRVKETLFALGDHLGKGVELSKKVLSAMHDAFVMKSDVVLGVDGSAAFDSPFEIFEIAPVVAVVRAKGGEVNVGYEEHSIGFDEKSTVASGVTGEVDNFDM